MPDVAVELEERAGIEQFFHSLAGEQLPLLALSRDRALAARMPRLLAQLGELAQLGAGGIGFGRHNASVSRPQAHVPRLPRSSEGSALPSHPVGGIGLVARRLASDRGLRRPRNMRHSYIDRPRRIRAPRATPRSRARFLPAVVALPAVAVLWLTIGLPMLSQLTSAGGSNRFARKVVFTTQAGGAGADASGPQTVAAATVSDQVLAAYRADVARHS